MDENSREQAGIPLDWGEQAAEAPVQGREVLRGSARAERRFGNGSSIPGVEESSEERSLRALRAERGFRGKIDGKDIERVAKP